MSEQPVDAPPALSVVEVAERVDAMRSSMDDLIASGIVAVGAGVPAVLAGIVAQFRADLVTAGADPILVRAARLRAVKALGAVRASGVGPVLLDQAAAGAVLGASLPTLPGAGLSAPVAVSAAAGLPVWAALRARVRGVDRAVRWHAGVSAAALRVMPVRTSAQVDALAGRITAVGSEINAAVTDAVVSGAAAGAQAAGAAAGVDMVWVARRGCCLVCAEMAGSTARAGELHAHLQSFGVVAELRRRMVPLAHPRCRCVLVPDTPGVAEWQSRQAQTWVARGEVIASGMKLRRAIDTMLSSKRFLLRATKRDAERTLNEPETIPYANAGPAYRGRSEPGT